jgi:hypothetical protein
LFKCYNPKEIKAIINGSTPIPSSLCQYIDEDALIRYEETLEQYESENKSIDTIRDYSMCRVPCNGEFCSKHLPTTSQCIIIDTIPHKNLEKIKLVPCQQQRLYGEYCSKHVPRLTCREKQNDGKLCKEKYVLLRQETKYCKLYEITIDEFKKRDKYFSLLQAI